MSESDDGRQRWNRLADDWDIQVGDDGDSNRINNSDPVLWNFTGDVAGKCVLDAGCGTGYLSRKLRERGARVIGIDISDCMIEIARSKAPDIDFRVASCSSISGIPDGTVDLVVSNYVLMDTPDMEEALREFARVLKTGGIAVLIFSHPCFPAGASTCSVDEDGAHYHWAQSYFEQRRGVDPPWNHFKHDFVWYHRPLSDYWRAFKAAGFEVEDFDEPHAPANGESAGGEGIVRPFSVAFKLRHAGIRSK
ncbi:MAG: class I SAM-dependent methyltransferase [Planctomycetes bacterium]|nr:class I SAM-dependent methyltransferase [Planctomycetota bacterium]NOG55481.1 class I SAM-dependent methyltransferase [Planctomycetota bacterium]